MKNIKNKFIIFEGIDCSGTTTQSKLLSKCLTEHNIKNIWMCEPTDNGIGKLIRDILGGRVKLNSDRIDNKVVTNRRASPAACLTQDGQRK